MQVNIIPVQHLGTIHIRFRAFDTGICLDTLKKSMLFFLVHKAYTDIEIEQT